MVLLQLLLPSGTSQIRVPLYGKYRIRLNNVSVNVTSATGSQLIQLQGRQFQLSYPGSVASSSNVPQIVMAAQSLRYPAVLVQGSSSNVINQFLIGSAIMEWTTDLDGFLEIYPYDMIAGGSAVFLEMLIVLDVEPCHSISSHSR